VYDLGQEGNIHYMVMEHVPGQSLKTHLQAVERMTLWDSLRVIQQVGAALHYAHERGLVHRDIKPANIMLRAPGGEAILTDFGLAMIVSGMRLTGSNMIGTPTYMAPEQISESATVDRRADIYSLGIMLYEMMTGRVPFDADTPVAVILKHLHEPLPDPRKLCPDLPDAIVRVIEKALAKEPEQRYQTMQEMLEALELVQVTPQQVRDALKQHFNASELRDVCFDLKIDYDSLPGEGAGDKARELAAYCERHGRLAELGALVKKLRSHAW
jgi:serine/threonine-protein kinase